MPTSMMNKAGVVCVKVTPKGTVADAFVVRSTGDGTADADMIDYVSALRWPAAKGQILRAGHCRCRWRWARWTCPPCPIAARHRRRGAGRRRRFPNPGAAGRTAALLETVNPSGPGTPILEGHADSA